MKPWEADFGALSRFSAGSSGSTGFPNQGVSRSHDNLPVLQKTTSYPASPTSPISPTETEFGATPIDASFGERIDSHPPERPAPEKPALGDRSGLPSQKSRGVGMNYTEPAKKTGNKMDKYARQAGDDSYESEGADADDEFERTIFNQAAPTMFDDGESDHPSESDDEDHDLLDGEDTPTTQGWGDRENRSPTGNMTQWNEEQVADYIISLSSTYKQYSQAFIDEGIKGDVLVDLHHDDLQDLGINSLGDRLTILKSVYEHKIRSGIKGEEGQYVPLSAADDRSDLNATQDDITRVIDAIKQRDQRIYAAEAELKAMRQDLDRIFEENRKLRDETLPIMRLVKPLPDPAGGTIPSPREIDLNKQNENLAPAAAKESKGSSLSRKFSTKKLFLGSAPKQPSPTHPPQTHTPQPQREVRDDLGGAQLEASAAAMAASSHLTASMTSQISPSSVHGSQLSPTSPAYSTQAPSSGGSYQPPNSAAARSFPREVANARDRHPYDRHNQDDNGTGTGYSGTSHWSQASTIVAPDRDRDRDPPASARPSRRQLPTPSPREDEIPQTAPLPRERDRDRGDRDNPQVEIFKSFRVSIEDPCRVVLPVALKRYNITDDWRQYALYIVHGDQERCLGLEEKPLLLFKQLDKEGRKPMFMLRRHASPAEGWSSQANLSGAPGGSGQGLDGGSGSGGGGGGREKAIPGGVL
ncbi:hypothetical protein LTR78_000425 [Recurvomyces mirabilis]|uniref:Uncharacterized protein n=1 Tax=Recurvomyces mirabilis TaxID=574656 RepID=A0AAE0WXZ1_9PEZI|nr:hypothetical protein LTR78_000425 [Recurvomyces mirabilis]KAK5162080.1 hypothetical protein LTS14_000426 [Recurvomyces mirabilis]